MQATQANVGENTIADCPRLIARWNEREDWETFTSHSFRRTTATRMAENGATILDIQIAGGWKSEKIARKYVESSNKTKVFIQIIILFIITNITLLLAKNRHQDRTFFQCKSRRTSLCYRKFKVFIETHWHFSARYPASAITSRRCRKWTSNNLFDSSFN